MVKATEVTTGLTESNGSLPPGLWRDSLHVIWGVTACTPGSAPGPTEYGKTLPFNADVCRCGGCSAWVGTGAGVTGSRMTSSSKCWKATASTPTFSTRSCVCCRTRSQKRACICTFIRHVTESVVAIRSPFCGYKNRHMLGIKWWRFIVLLRYWICLV